MHHASVVAESVGAVAGLLLLAAMMLLATRALRLPFTAVLVLVGLALNALQAQFPDPLAVLDELTLSPELILYVFLPTLVFESSFNLDARRLRHNLGPILTLAVPGLLLSTLVIGGLVAALTEVPLPAALLLGAILSATDPVAVIAMFKQLGAPHRLTVLVEGESLFNDATAIVLTRLLVGVLAAESLGPGMVGQGVLQFLLLFGGGFLVGVLLAAAVGWILGQVESEPAVEISLTTALAYLSFLLAEEVLGLSGVMATVGAGLTLGGWGRIKISQSVRVFMERFWAQLAFIANSLIFLLVGLSVSFPDLGANLPLLAWTLLGTLLARALLVYGVLPMVGHLPGSRPVGHAYQAVMFWGGLRGAIALALVMSLPPSPYTEAFTAVVTGVVLFTLLVQGLTIEPLIHRLGLDRPSLADRLALLERDLEAREIALDRVPRLTAGGLFSAPLARQFQHDWRRAGERIRHRIERLRREELTGEQELRLLYLRVFAEEHALYTEMYNDGHLSEGAYRELILVLHLQADAVRYHGQFEHVHSHRMRRLLERGAYRLLDRLSPLAPVAERLRLRRIVRNYEEVWGHYQGSHRVLRFLETLQGMENIPEGVIDEVRSHYRHWHQLAGRQLRQVSEQFPEFVTDAQRRLGRRVLLLSEAEATRELADKGTLARDRTETMLADIQRDLSRLRGRPPSPLDTHPERMLRRVPLFAGLGERQLGELVRRMRQRTIADGEHIVEQGETGESLLLIARGLVRLSASEDGKQHDLGTLMAGDFFGERALMGHESRAATVEAITPCIVYELLRADLDEVGREHPAIVQRLEETDRQRRQELAPERERD